MLKTSTHCYFRYLLAGLLYWVSLPMHALVLPEDRADILYHSYDGGGAEISGPSVLVRKKFSESVSASVNHYVDNVSSASIDVVTTASPYTETRVENSLNLDYLHEKTQMSAGFSRSDENDFDAQTFSISISQDMWGDLTTVSLGYAQGDNTVRQNTDPDFQRDLKTRNYRVSLTQVMTKDLIMALAMETITDEGYLNNPYRSVRYLDSSVTQGYSFESERYPNTRTSNAVAIRAKYFIEPRSALHAGYRLFADSWGISANTFELGYTIPYQQDWIFEISYRFNDQTSADFYSDLFPNQNAQNFLARDKELSTFINHTIGAGVNWEFKRDGGGLIKRASLNLNVDWIYFDYEDFRDITVSTPVAGEEPAYNFNATVIRFFLSVWF